MGNKSSNYKNVSCETEVKIKNILKHGENISSDIIDENFLEKIDLLKMLQVASKSGCAYFYVCIWDSSIDTYNKEMNKQIIEKILNNKPEYLSFILRCNNNGIYIGPNKKLLDKYKYKYITNYGVLKIFNPFKIDIVIVK